MKTALIPLGAHQPPWANFKGPDCEQVFTIPFKPFAQEGAKEYASWDALKSDESTGNYLAAWSHLDLLGYEMSTSLSRVSGCFVPDAQKEGKVKAHGSLQIDWVYVRKMESKESVNNPGAGMIIVHDLITGGSGWLDMMSNAPFPWMPTSLKVALRVDEFTRAISCIDGSSGACTMLPALVADDPVARIPVDTQVGPIVLESPTQTSAYPLYPFNTQRPSTPLVESLRNMTSGDGLVNWASLHIMNLEGHYKGLNSGQTEPFPLMRFGPGAPKDLRPTSRVDYMDPAKATPLGPLDQAAYLMLEDYFPEAALRVKAFADTIPAGVCHYYQLKASADTMAMVLERSGAAGHTLLGKVWQERASDIGDKFPISQDHPFLQELKLPVGPLNMAEFFLNIGERLEKDCPKEPLSTDLALAAFREAARLQHPYAAIRAHEIVRDPREIGSYGVVLNETESLLYDPSSFEFLHGGVYFPEGTDPAANLIQLHQIYRRLDLKDVQPYEMYFFSGLVRKAFLEMRRDVNYLENKNLREEFRGDNTLWDYAFSQEKELQFNLGKWFAEIGDYFRRLQTDQIKAGEKGQGKSGNHVVDTRAEEYAVLNYEYAVTLGHEPTRDLLREYALMTGDADAAVWAGQTDFYRIELFPIVGMALALGTAWWTTRVPNRRALALGLAALIFSSSMGVQEGFAYWKDLGFDPDRIGETSTHSSLVNTKTVLKDGRDFAELFKIVESNPEDDAAYFFATRQALRQLTRLYGQDRYEPQKYLDKQDVYVVNGLNFIVENLGGGIRAQHRAAGVLDSFSAELNSHFVEYQRLHSQDDERANMRLYNKILGVFNLLGLESPDGEGFNNRNFITALFQQLGTKVYTQEFQQAAKGFFARVEAIKKYYEEEKHWPKPGMNTDAMVQITGKVLEQDSRKPHGGIRK